MTEAALIERLWRLSFGANKPLTPNPIPHLWVVAMGASEPPANALAILAQVHGLEYSVEAETPAPARTRRKATTPQP